MNFEELELTRLKIELVKDIQISEDRILTGALQALERLNNKLKESYEQTEPRQ